MIKQSVKTRQRGNSWSIYWYHKRQMYHVTLPGYSEDETDTIRLKAELWLKGEGEIPEEIEASPSVRKYLEAINQKPAESEPEGIPDDILEGFRGHLEANVSAGWTAQSLSYLKMLKERFGSFESIRERDASLYIDGLTKKYSKSTRNKHFVIINKFYKWLCKDYGLENNPFSGLKQVKIRNPNDDIVYASKRERKFILKLADRHRLGISLWLAYMAGLRLTECFQVRPEDINWQNETIRVARSKTGRPRSVPLAKSLIERIEIELSKKKRPKVPTITPNTNKAHHTAAMRMVGAIRKQIRRYMATCNAPEERVQELCDLAAFNAGRHTFCTHLVMGGVSLDKVAHLSGHTPEVCRRYYARFVPKDNRDNSIDLLD